MKIFILIYSTHFPNVSSKSIFILFLGEISRENPFNATDIKKKKHPPIITTCYLYKQVFFNKFSFTTLSTAIRTTVKKGFKGKDEVHNETNKTKTQ